MASSDKENNTVGRRAFLGVGAASVAGAALTGCAQPKPSPAGPPTAKTGTAGDTDPVASAKKKNILQYRVLGRTEFWASDISMGCGRVSEPAVVRYAADRGINFFDTSERYGNGASERAIGGAMQHLKRDDVFIATKLKLKADESEQSVLDRFGRCLERLKTPYADGLYIHSATHKSLVKHAGFHAAFAKLKAAGKVRFCGISSHGPRDSGGHSLKDVLLAAVEDGRFDLMLLAYSFLNREGPEAVLDACREKNIGATLMKVTPPALTPLAFDANNPDHARYVKMLKGRGKSHDEAVAQLTKRLDRARAEMDRSREAVDAFLACHGIKAREQLKDKSIQWALQYPGAATVCVSIGDFDTVDRVVPLSNIELTSRDQRYLIDYAQLFGSSHCRYGCTACADACPHDVPVSTVMRYAYYFQTWGREKLAMAKYAALDRGGAAPCLGCHGPCVAACPHQLSVQAQLWTAHDLLRLG